MKHCERCGSAWPDDATACPCSGVRAEAGATTDMDVDARHHRPPELPPVSVWFCTPEAFPRLLSWSIASDKGTLAIGPGRIQFHGNKQSDDLREIAGARLTGLYWPT